ncbi:MAG: glycosyltransferase family 4 protein [Chloroflexales bacterium]
MKHLLVISHDVVGSHMAGPGIRYWELARALAPYVAVTLLAPRPINLAAPDFATGSYAWGDAASLASYLARADVILANGFVLEAHSELGNTGTPLIIDLYDPTLLENLELLRAADPAARVDRNRRDVALLNRQVAAGDFFLCATERQRDLYIGALMAAGRVSPERVDADPLLRDLIDVVPFGLPAEPPARTGSALRGTVDGIGPDDPIILWSGGLWDWMDPQSLIQAMPAVVSVVPNVRLVFLAGKHPGPVAAMRTLDESRSLAHQIGLLDSHVFFYESWVPYACRADFLLDASIVVSLHRQHLETTYAALRSRILDHLWVGRASVVSAGDAAAELVAHYDLGRVVPPQDVAAVAQTLCDLLADSAALAACARRAQALAVEFRWERVSMPVRRFCAAPHCTRPAVPDGQPQGAASPSVPTPIPPPTMDTTMNDQTRNDTLSRLDDLWKIQPQPLRSGLPILGQAKEAANSLTRWYVQAIVDQQNGFNASAVQAIQALAASDDTRHSELTVHIHALHHLLNVSTNQSRQSSAATQHLTDQLSHRTEALLHRFDGLSQRLDGLSQRLDGLSQRLDGLSHHISDVDDAETILAAAVSELRELAAAVASDKEPS